MTRANWSTAFTKHFVFNTRENRGAMNQINKAKADILIVDNDEAVTRALSLRLEDAGNHCHIAYSAVQALALFQQHPIDLIVTDLNMPGGGGAALVQGVRQTSDVPIIVVTGFSDEMRQGVKGKGVTVLRKPFEIQSILELIELEQLGRHHRAA